MTADSPSPGTPRPSFTRNLVRGVGVVAVLAAATGGILTATRASDEGGAQEAPLPPSVTVAPPVVERVTDWRVYTGRFEAVERVDIRARVSGHLESIHFNDGQIIRKGDLLFVIDPRPFAAAVAQAGANLQRARSQLALATLELERGERLLPKNVITREAYDTRRVNRDVARAEVAAAQAALRAAELDLAYSKVHAPVTGRASSAQVDTGNLVNGDSGTGTVLTTIVSVDPIHFTFDVPESDYLAFAGALSDVAVAGRSPTLPPVGLHLHGETGWPHHGDLEFVDNQLDRQTGTIRLRASFANKDGLLLPGLFGEVRMATAPAYDALLVPESAIFSDQAAKLVLVVDDENTVQPRPVVLGPAHGDHRIVREGIGPDDRIIVSGLLRARPGGKVTPRPLEVADGGN